MENSTEAPQKTKIELQYDPIIPLLGIYPKEFKSGYNKGNSTYNVCYSIISIAKVWKQSRCTTTDERIKKMWYLYTMESTQP
jgi:hypothetical protein